MTSSLRRFGALLLAGLGLVLSSMAAHADPPYRVARLSYENGAVSFSPAGESDWSRAFVNRPLVTGDRLWVDAGSRAELQLDGAALRIGDRTSLQLLNVDDRIAQIQLTQGELDLRIWRLDPDQRIEIDTPNLAFVVTRPGSYRIDADEKYGSTAVTVRAGEATLYGESNAFRVGPGDTWEFFDTALRDYDTYRPEPPDDLARFAMARDQRWEASVSARHVSRELIGFEELDDYGTWQQEPDYGWVWFPTRVAVGWAPYREGHWAWVEPWGWTWIDDAPWGFAPSHYGRWAFVRERWCWVPGPVAVRPVYAPALVAFVGGEGLSVSVGVGSGVVGWFPLGPREVYRPAYAVSRDYFTRVNVTNTVVNVTQVTNVYETRNVTNIVYRNQRVPGAVVAVPTTTFTQARPVARDVVRVRAENVQPQAVTVAPPVVPARQSVLGPQPARERPPEGAFRRQVFARTAPPPPPAPIESRLPALRSHPGQPAPSTSATTPRPGAQAVPAPSVKVVPAAQPSAAPPPPAPAANRPERERRGPPVRAGEQAPARPEQPTPAAAPRAPSPPAAAVPTPVPAPPLPPGVERRREEERARSEERQRERPPLGRPAAPQAPVAPPAPAAAPTPPALVAPPVPAPPPAARPPEGAPAPQQRREERREQREERREEPAPRFAPAVPTQPAPVRPQPSPQVQPAPQMQVAPPPPARAPNARAEERRQAASEREQRNDEREQRRP